MISMDKKYRTRDGREARIYATDRNTDAARLAGVQVEIDCEEGEGL